MKLTDLKNIKRILGQSHDDVNSGGKPIQNIYEGIRDNNSSLSNEEVMQMFLAMIKFLLVNQMVKLAGIYDYKNNREISWKGSSEEVVNMLEEWISKFSKEKLENDPEYFFEFKYCFLVWQIEWSEVLERFGLEDDD